MATNNKMKRLGSKKSDSWWWDSHISPKNSRWLDDNLQDMDKQVKEMLLLIEEEGDDSFAKNAETYSERRPQLIAHVENFYRMYRALAERYDDVTGELRKNISESESESESESGSESEKNGDGIVTGFEIEERISELEEELKQAKERIGCLEEEKLVLARTSDALEANLVANRHETECLRGAMEAELSRRDVEIAKLREDFLEEKSHLEAKLSAVRGSNEELRVEIERILEEKGALEHRVLELERTVTDLKVSAQTSNERFYKEKCCLDAKIAELANANDNLEVKIVRLNDTIVALDEELSNRANEIVALNSQLNERANEIVTLNSQLNEHANKIVTLNSQLNEHANKIVALNAQLDERASEIVALNLRLATLTTEIKELEREIERQNAVILENAEGKREAIRQLCISVEYYRDGYCQLREIIRGHKRHFVMAN